MVTRLGIINWKTCARKRPWPNLGQPFRGTDENKPVAGTTQKRNSTLSYSFAMIERIYLRKPILNMENQTFMRPQLRLSSVGRHSSAGITTRLRDGQPSNRGSIPGNDRICISSPMRPERLWGSPRFLLSASQSFHPGNAAVVV
jgi:hypothetical protein